MIDSLVGLSVGILLPRIDEIVGSVLSKTAGEWKKKKAVSRALKDYSESAIDEAEWTWTLLNRHQRILLREMYHPLLAGGQKVLVPREVDGRGRKVLVLGRAGSGKSTFAKFQFLEFVASLKMPYPILLELSDLNQALPKEPDFKHPLNELDRILGRYGLSFGHDLWHAILSSGRVALFLDGVDEVHKRHRTWLRGFLTFLKAQCPMTPVFLFSRFQVPLGSVPAGFERVDLSPLEREEFPSFINALPVDNLERKREFQERITEEFWEKRKDFLENPLLATLMFFTFGEWGDDETEHQFYEHTVQTLLHRQDPGRILEREYATHLGRPVLRKVLENLSVLAVSERAYKFTSGDLARWTHEIEDYPGSPGSLDPDDVLNDLVTAIGVAVVIGDRYRFIHPAIPEYLSATFFLRVGEELRRELSNSMTSQGNWGHVLRIIQEINPEAFQRDILFPALTRVFDPVLADGTDGTTARELSMMRALRTRVVVGPGNVFLCIPYTCFGEEIALLDEFTKAEFSIRRALQLDSSSYHVLHQFGEEDSVQDLEAYETYEASGEESWSRAVQLIRTTLEDLIRLRSEFRESETRRNEAMRKSLGLSRS